MRLLITLLTILFNLATITAQVLKERLILTDNNDRFFINSEFINFDADGNYCFEIKKGDSEYYFYTITDTLGPFDFISRMGGSTSNVSYARPADKTKPAYYKNNAGTKIYPYLNLDIKWRTDGGSRQGAAIRVSSDDSDYYYINGKIVDVISRNRGYKPMDEDWCAFSDNGNNVYIQNRNDIYSAYVNGELIDTSLSRFIEPQINNNGYYIFAEGRKPKQKMGKYDHMFFPHNNDTTLGYVRTFWFHDLRDDGAWYATGDDNGPEYIAVNNILYKDIDSVDNINLVNKNHYLFTCTDSQGRKLVADGKSYPYSYDKIFHPVMDSSGNFAMYGQKDYYIYKYVNGKQLPNPISKFGVRPIPLYISPTGESIHYFKTEDSTYIYRDNKLLFPKFSNKKTFKALPYSDVMYTGYIRGKAKTGNSLFYLEVNDKGYLVYNGVLSKPMMPALESGSNMSLRVGRIIECEFNEKGFFIIQQTGKKSYLININNKLYQEIKDIDSIPDGNCFFDGKQLIFYAVKGSSFYQYTLQQ